MESEEVWKIISGDERSPHMHQALEEILLNEVANGERIPTIRFWEDTRENVMLGCFQSVKNEVCEERTNEEGVDICRRITGGGAMFTEPKSQITYSLYLPEEMIESDSIRKSYAELDKFAVEALRDLGYEVSYEPINDIVSPKGKIGGAAQARRNGAVLHHTRITYKMNVKKMVKYLKIGEEKIIDKAIKSAGKRVSPLYDLNPQIERNEVLEALIDSFSKKCSALEEDQVTNEEAKNAEKLVSEKHGSRDWLYRFE